MANKLKTTNSDGGFILGIVFLGIGILLLLRKLGFLFPDWILSWPMILIVVGVVISLKHQFKSLFGLFMMGLGVFFLLEREFNFDFGLDRYIVPLVLIGVGIHLILKKRKEKDFFENRHFSPLPNDVSEKIESEKPKYSDFEGQESSFSNRLYESAVLSGVNKRVVAKDLSGGKLTAVMGGIDLDLTQADFLGAIYLQVDVIFGGIKLIVPPHWQIQTEVTNIAAGIEDKRLYRQSEVDDTKVLIIRGTILFGGLEIKSF